MKKNTNDVNDSDVWVKLDNGIFEGVDKIKKMFFQYVEREEREEKDIPYIETLNKGNHDVFVTDSKHKAFGQFMGGNPRGKAIIRFEHESGLFDFDSRQVISM